MSTPFDYAVRLEYPKIAEVFTDTLLEYGARPTKNTFEYLKGQIEFIQERVSRSKHISEAEKSKLQNSDDYDTYWSLHLEDVERLQFLKKMDNDLTSAFPNIAAQTRRETGTFERSSK